MPLDRQKYNRDWKRANAVRLAARRREIYAETHGEQHRLREQQRAERAPLMAQAALLAAGIRDRAAKFNLERSPALAHKEFFVSWLTHQPSCPCCSVPFSLGRKAGRVRDDSPSIDRFIPTRGYTLDNIALICWRCNNIKRNYAASDLRRVANWIDVWGNQTDKFREVA